MTASSDGANRWRWGRLAALGTLIGAVGGLWAFSPDEFPFYPPCWLHALTGWHCGCCGLTRALHAVLHGDLRQALAWNPLFVLVLPLLFLLLGRAAVAWWRGQPWRWPSPSGWVVAWLIVLFLTYSVARNLPGELFAELAPHRL